MKLYRQDIKRTHLWQQTLGQQFFGPPSELDVEQGVVGLLDLRMPEAAETELDHGAVIQDLRDCVRVSNRVLKQDQIMFKDVLLR